MAENSKSDSGQGDGEKRPTDDRSAARSADRPRSRQGGYQRRDGGDRGRRDERTPRSGFRGNDGERKQYGNRSNDGDRKPYGNRSSDGDRKPYGNRSSDGERKPYGDRSNDGDRKPYGNRSSDGERKPYGDRKPYGEGRNDSRSGGWAPRSAREDRPRSVGDHPGTSRHRDYQPTGGSPARRDGGSQRNDRRFDDRPRRDDGGRGRFERRDDRGAGRPRRDDDGRGRSDRRDDRGQDRRRDDRGAGRGRDDRGQDRRSYRPGEPERSSRPFEPQIPAGITGRELDVDALDELKGLSKETAERVAKHMVAAFALEAEDPEASQGHAKYAARIGGRIGVVRETYGILAYRAGDYATAVRELRTALRITGRCDVLPMIADSERGLGRPERALDLAASDDASGMGADAAIELMIVVAGAYADTGDIQTALRTLEIPALRHKVDGRWQVRLWVAYADLLERADRTDEARRWLTLAADTDTEGLTDAAERLGRPSPIPAPEPSWEDDEQILVVDAFEEETQDAPEPEGEDPVEQEPEDQDRSDDDGDEPSDVEPSDDEGRAEPELVTTPDSATEDAR